MPEKKSGELRGLRLALKHQNGISRCSRSMNQEANAVPIEISLPSRECFS